MCVVVEYMCVCVVVHQCVCVVLSERFIGVVFFRMFVKELLPVLLTLSVMCVSLWAATNWSVKFIQPISRRLTNLPYILWMVRFITPQLNLFCLQSM